MPILSDRDSADLDRRHQPSTAASVRPGRAHRKRNDTSGLRRGSVRPVLEALEEWILLSSSILPVETVLSPSDVPTNPSDSSGSRTAKQAALMTASTANTQIDGGAIITTDAQRYPDPVTL